MAAEILLFALLGLATGAVYAGLGVALVITHKGSRVVNFAQGAVAMWGAFVYEGLHSAGVLYLPVVGIPSRIRLGGPMPVGIALVGAVVSTAAVSLIAYFLVFYPLRRAPDLSKIVASVGVMMLLEAIATVQFGSGEQVVPPIFPSGSFSVFGKAVPIDLIAVAAVVVAVTAAVWAYFRFTRPGLATVAVAQSERDVALLGRRPGRIAAGAWTLSGAVAGLFGVLVAPIIGVNSADYTLFIVPALAVALAGRLTSLPITCLAGLALGMAESVVGYATTLPGFPSWASSGAQEALPLLLVVVVLALQGHRLATPAEVGQMARVYRPRRTAMTVGILAAIGVVALLLTSGTVRFGIIETIAAVPVMLSFVVLTGLTGQISLAQVALAGVAALTLSKLGAVASLPFPLSPLIATAAAMAIGLVIALPALRIRGTQLAIVTIAFAIVIEDFVLANPALVAYSINQIASPQFLGVDLAVRQGADIARLSFGLLVLLVALLFVAGALNIGRSRTGLRFLAVRSSERGAASVGVNVTATKLLAFALASVGAGFGGSLIGYSFGQFSAGSFDVLAAGLPFLAFAYLGGITSVSGAILASTLVPAGIVAALLSGVGTALGEYYLLASGLALIIAAIAYPQGMTGAFQRMAPLLTLLPVAPRARRALLAVRSPFRGLAQIRRGVGTGETPSGVISPPAAPLVVHDLTVAFGGVVAVDHASLRISPGEVVGLIGANGAGKTSLINAVTGFAGATGSVQFGGAELIGLAPHRIARAGVLRTWQTPTTFGDLAVWEDLMVASAPPRRGAAALDLLWPSRDGRACMLARECLRTVGIEELLEHRGEKLTTGQQKLVGIARVLMRQPQALLLDEPAAGLDRLEGVELAQRVRTLAEAGAAVLLVDHDMEFVFASCDRVYVLDFGRIIAEGPPDRVRADPKVRTAYLGTAGDETTVAPEAAAGAGSAEAPP